MRTILHMGRPRHISAVGLVLVGFITLGMGSCTSPHAPTRRMDADLDPGRPKGNPFFTQIAYQAVKGTLPTVPDAEYVNDDEICGQCHPAYAKTFAENVHRGGGCESCHGPASKHVEARGKQPGLIFSFKSGDPVARAEACLRCHEENACSAGSKWRTSRHGHQSVTCVDCHRGHYNVPEGTPATQESQASNLTRDRSIEQTAYVQAAKESASVPAKDSTMGGKMPSLRGTSGHLGANSPAICYKCHADFQGFAEIAGPHQIGGANGFNCTTCHNPHGQILEYSRKDLCMTCHGSHAPTMAWQSCSHALNGVACTDCHNPHPRTSVPQVVDISHWEVKRPQRQPMSVQEPETCYKCHQKIYGLNALPSHHPIKEGKMVCSDCHDAHGQYADNLKEATVNLVCYKCHADKQGPWAYEHAPVRENCDICHNPHGAVANNLLKQQPTFLCLRCHPGHYSGNHHPNSKTNDWLGIDKQPGFNTPTATSLRRPLYTDCTLCHQQVHGTNQISEEGANGRFTR